MPSHDFRCAIRLVTKTATYHVYAAPTKTPNITLGREKRQRLYIEPCQSALTAVACAYPLGTATTRHGALELSYSEQIMLASFER